MKIFANSNLIQGLSVLIAGSGISVANADLQEVCSALNYLKFDLIENFARPGTQPYLRDQMRLSDVAGAQSEGVTHTIRGRSLQERRRELEFRTRANDRRHRLFTDPAAAGELRQALCSEQVQQNLGSIAACFQNSVPVMNRGQIEFVNRPRPVSAVPGFRSLNIQEVVRELDQMRPALATLRHGQQRVAILDAVRGALNAVSDPTGCNPPSDSAGSGGVTQASAAPAVGSSAQIAPAQVVARSREGAGSGGISGNGGRRPTVLNAAGSAGRVWSESAGSGGRRPTFNSSVPVLAVGRSTTAQVENVPQTAAISGPQAAATILGAGIAGPVLGRVIPAATVLSPVLAH